MREFTGTKFDRNLTTTEIAKRIRADIKEAARLGEIPAAAKYSVKTKYFSAVHRSTFMSGKRRLKFSTPSILRRRTTTVFAVSASQPALCFQSLRTSCVLIIAIHFGHLDRLL